MERTYTIPIRKFAHKAPTYHRANRAVRAVREYLQRHMKTQDVRLGEELNKALWARGDSKPPARVTVFVKKDEEIAYAELAGKEFKKKDFSEKEDDKKETRGLAGLKLPKKESKKEEAAEIAEAVAGEKAAEPTETKPAAKKAPAKKQAKK